MAGMSPAGSSLSRLHRGMGTKNGTCSMTGGIRFAVGEVGPLAKVLAQNCSDRLIMRSVF